MCGENDSENGRGISPALSFSMRRANLDDLPALLTVQARCYSPQMNEPETVWQRRLQQAAALCWIAESGGAIHAYLAAYPARLGHVTALDGDFAPPPLADCRLPIACICTTSPSAPPPAAAVWGKHCSRGRCTPRETGAGDTPPWSACRTPPVSGRGKDLPRPPCPTRQHGLRWRVIRGRRAT